jgi:hypothetical protein
LYGSTSYIGKYKIKRLKSNLKGWEKGNIVDPSTQRLIYQITWKPSNLKLREEHLERERETSSLWTKPCETKEVHWRLK